MRVLVVEDQPDAARMLAKALRDRTYAVDVAADGDAACHSAKVNHYDVILLDVMLPRRDGFSVCRELREAGSAVPILMLTARDEIEARVAGLDVGADDYLVKPFDLRELLARVRALGRRRARVPLPDAFTVGDLRFDVGGRQVYVSERALDLTAKEYALLELFARHAGIVMGRAYIAEHVWDDAFDPFSNVIDVYVQRLRRKLENRAARSLIETRRGEGYRLLPVSPEI
jgi:two-component system copper resistance phosphate regulon response regulator CusR